jgi:DNA-binding SARP family transcriptional activator
MRFLILGPLEVRGEQGAVTLSGSKLRGLLAVLLLHANKPVSAERLALALWGQDAPSGATKTVQVHVSRLRKALGDTGLVATTPAGYCLQVRPDELDAARFERLVEDGQSALAAGQPGTAAALLRQALSLWRGPALADLAFEPFAAAEITRLEEQHLAALETRIEADLAAGRHADLVGELRRLVALNPTRERLAAHLMLSLYRCGRQTDALETYQHTRAALITDAGVEPGPQLRELQEAILRHNAALQLRESALDLSPALDAATVSPLVGCEEEPIVLAFPRSLQSPASSLFVGREAELKRLRDRWTEVCSSSCSAVLIGGEAGIGKTRLAGELAHTVHREGALVLFGRCDEGLAVPYQPFVEALGPYVRAVGVDRIRAQLGHLAPALGRMWPELTGLGEPVRGDPESERFALFEAVAGLIEAATHERRVLLIVDDLHWAAQPTLLLLRHLIRSERQLGVLLLGTYRQTELDAGQPLAQLLADLHRDSRLDRLSIGGLPEVAIAAMLEMAVGHALDEQTSQLVHLLQTHTAGNPFFVRELVANLTESGKPFGADVNAVRLEAPEALRHVIMQRVARLSASCGRALEVAAVAGSTFSFMLLERVLGEDSGVLDALDEAVAAGLLTEAEHGDYAFAHALVRQTIYGQLGSARRIRLHRRLGEALETLDGAQAHVEALAHHFTRAAADGQDAKAADYALAAGSSAAARLGYENAAAHYERGLEALTLTGRPQHERRCELLLALGEARWRTGELDQARQAYRQAAELAEKLGDSTALARAALGFCGPHRSEMTASVTGPVADLLQQALAALADDDSALRAQLMGRLGAVLAYTGVERRKRVLAHQGLAMARRIADKATLADVLASTLWATHGPDALPEAMAIAQELAHVASDLGDPRLEATAHARLFEYLLQVGDIDAVERELDALQRLAEARRERYFKWVLAVVQANQAHLRGRLDDYETLARDALAQRYEGQDEAAAQIFGAQMLVLRISQGRSDELLDTVESLAAQYPQNVSWRFTLAFVYVLLERREQAREVLEELTYADLEDVPRDGFWLTNLCALSEVVFFLRDGPRAQLLSKLLLPYADRCVSVGVVVCQGSVSRPLGLLATTLARYDEAEHHFKHALKMHAQIRSPLWIAYTQHDYARMLLLRNHAGDTDNALQLLTEVLATAKQLGLKTLSDRAQPLKLAAETAKPIAGCFRDV